MASEIHVHGFESSNNMKVRVALGYKQIPYEFHTIDREDRTEILRLSGQYLTPVMVHGNTVVFDSAAILRYLEANFKGRPPLFGSSMAQQWEIEELEFFGRTTLAGPMGELVHHRLPDGTLDEALRSKCSQAFVAAATTLVERLAGREWLVGDKMSAADVTAAAVMHRVQKAKFLELPRGIETIGGWVSRVMSYDRYYEKPAS